MAQAGISVSVDLKEIMRLLCKKCQEKVKEYVKQKVAEQITERLLE